MTQTLTPAETARKAAAYIREHGLAKQDLLGPNGEACFNGAIMLQFAPPDYELPLNDTLKLWQLVGGYVRQGSTAPYRDMLWQLNDRANLILRFRGAIRRVNQDVVLWNNEEERTAEEVAQLLDEIAEEIEGELTNS